MTSPIEKWVVPAGLQPGDIIDKEKLLKMAYEIVAGNKEVTINILKREDGAIVITNTSSFPVIIEHNCQFDPKNKFAYNKIHRNVLNPNEKCVEAGSTLLNPEQCELIRDLLNHIMQRIADPTYELRDFYLKARRLYLNTIGL